MSDELKDATQRSGSFWQTVQAVGWSFFGVRRRSAFEADVQKLNPVHVIIAGIVGVLLFIAVLVLLVRWVVGSGIAT